MKRIDRIYEFVKMHSLAFDKKRFQQEMGIEATYISEKLNILRNNVSLELNKLVHQGDLIKIKGRPVYYFDKAKAEELLGEAIRCFEIELDDFKTLFNKNNISGEDEEKDPFGYLIGASGSLANQVEQAKAAVLYPPSGLHTLIVGQTGVGKTLFANIIYKYGVYSKRYAKDTPFIVFNCADYYNNPQLLVSHIFGHVKGSFTGADVDKAGLIEKASGGILFLDEIHRLPPEGQEMIFYFMDTGTYNKLGETDRKRKAKVLIIGATTEDTDSSLLKTFVRRIPIIINIPNLENRPIKEKLDAIKFLFEKEANRVNKNIRVTPEVVRALIGSVSFGNIGQLKSNIQLLCAKGFLNSINGKDIELNFKMLPQNIKNGLIPTGGRRGFSDGVAIYIDTDLVITPDGKENIILEKDNYEPTFNLYKLIEDKTNILKNEGMDDEQIKKFLTTDINIHIKSFYNKLIGDIEHKENILKIVDQSILELAQEFKVLAEIKLKRKFNDRFLYALSLHLSAFLKRFHDDKHLKYSQMSDIIDNNQLEYEVALEIKDIIESKLEIIVPDMEVIYLTLLLSSIEEDDKGKVGILVVAHGDRTATSMLNVATTLLGNSNIAAINMPLDVNPQIILEHMIVKVNELDQGKGILLLVDMGSLSTFDTIIEEITKCRVRCLDMVSTPLVMEAIRKNNILDMDSDTLYKALKNFKGYGAYNVSESKAIKAILTICSTGDGTAIKIKELVETIIKDKTEEPINVIPISIRNMRDEIDEIQNKYTIIAVVGIMNPKINVPFISIENLIDGHGEVILSQILSNKVPVISKNNKIVVKELCEESLQEFLTYLNPKKVIGVLMDFASVLENKLSLKFRTGVKLSLMLHVACVLERVLIHEDLEYHDSREKLISNKGEIVSNACKLFKDALNIRITEDEILYIIDFIDQQVY